MSTPIRRVRRTLTRTENRWAEAALGTIFPSNAHPELRTGICDLDVASFLVDLRSRVPFRAALGLRIAIWLVALAPLFVLHRFRTISGLDPRAREVLVASLLTSSLYPVRQLVMLLKAMGALLYARSPAVRAAMMPMHASEDVGSGPRLIGLGRKPYVGYLAPMTVAEAGVQRAAVISPPEAGVERAEAGGEGGEDDGDIARAG